MQSDPTFRSSFVRVIALLAALVSTAKPAPAQIGGILDRAGDALDRVPTLGSFLEGDPPITTSLDDAVTEVAWLDDYEPIEMVPLEALVQNADGGFRLVPGAFGFAGQSYCLKAGTHGPGGGDGYAYAPLAGPKGTIVRHILQNSYAHPEIPQRDIQVLLWAIIARTKVGDMPQELQSTARSLLTKEEIRDLDGGALGLVPDEVMRRAMAELPPAARQVFEAEARLRSMLAGAEYDYGRLEEVAVLAGAAPPDPEGRVVPEGRWSYHTEGFFVRFFPSGYPRTTIHVFVPGGSDVARDGAGRVTRVADRMGRAVEVERDAAGSPSTIRLLRPDDLEAEVTWTGPFTAASRAAGAHEAEWRALLERIGGRGAPNASGLDELAEVRSALDGAGAVEPGGERALAEARAIASEAWMEELCRMAGSCAGAGGASGSGRAGGAGVRSRADSPSFDPSGTVGMPGNRSSQRLGQSPRCSGDDWGAVPEGRGGSALPAGDPIVQGLAEGVRRSGIANFGPEHIKVHPTRAGTFKFMIRLDENGCPLPNYACIYEAGGRGEVPPGSQVGAPTIVLGMVQFAGARTRVNARFVDVETGVIQDSRKADADGNDSEAVATAAGAAFDALGIPCSTAKNLLDQHTRGETDDQGPVAGGSVPLGVGSTTGG